MPKKQIGEVFNPTINFKNKKKCDYCKEFIIINNSEVDIETDCCGFKSCKQLYTKHEHILCQKCYFDPARKRMASVQKTTRGTILATNSKSK
jgi:hypothetical protein